MIHEAGQPFIRLTEGQNGKTMSHHHRFSSLWERHFDQQNTMVTLLGNSTINGLEYHFLIFIA
jgi:hypothetical protein